MQSMSGSVATISAKDLRAVVSRLFAAAGLASADADLVADGLVEAELEGIASHGVMLVDMYLERIRQGSISVTGAPTIVSDREAAIVIDAAHTLGHVSAARSIEIAIARARSQGAGIVAVRHGFHFGTARRYAVTAADQGCIGIVACNTRPLMPAPGGAERVVGNNPLAIAIPVDGPIPLVLDMATSEAAMGKIRMAEKAGQAIPDNRAVDADGAPTTDPTRAIAGMLLPASGPKGFGLALLIDLLCGLLSGGAFGRGVQPLYGDLSTPYDCSHLFIAIDVAHFGDLSQFRSRAAAAADAIRAGRRTPGVDRLFTPGEPEWQRRQDSGETVRLSEPVAAMLVRCCNEWDVPHDVLSAA